MVKEMVLSCENCKYSKISANNIKSNKVICNAYKNPVEINKNHYCSKYELKEEDDKI